MLLLCSYKHKPNSLLKNVALETSSYFALENTHYFNILKILLQMFILQAEALKILPQFRLFIFNTLHLFSIIVGIIPTNRLRVYIFFKGIVEQILFYLLCQ